MSVTSYNFFPWAPFDEPDATSLNLDLIRQVRSDHGSRFTVENETGKKDASNKCSRRTGCWPIGRPLHGLTMSMNRRCASNLKLSTDLQLRRVANRARNRAVAVWTGLRTPNRAYFRSTNGSHSIHLKSVFQRRIKGIARFDVAQVWTRRQTFRRTTTVHLIATMEWTEENILQLISAYEKYTLLWKASHPQHYNKIKKQDAWEEIGKEMQVKVEECKKKMTSILSSLRREKAKVKKSYGTGKGKDDVYESNWFAYKSLQFLYDKDTARCTVNTLTDEDDIGDLDRVTSDVDDRNLQESTEIGSSNEQMLPPTVPSTSKPKKKQKLQDERLDKAFRILEESSLRKDEGECQIFGNLVARKLQRYSFAVRSTVQEEIMATLFRADKSLYNQNQNPTSTSLFPLQSSLQDQQATLCNRYQHSNPPSHATLYRSGSPIRIPNPQISPALHDYYSTFSPTTPSSLVSTDSQNSEINYDCESEGPN